MNNGKILNKLICQVDYDNITYENIMPWEKYFEKINGMQTNTDLKPTKFNFKSLNLRSEKLELIVLLRTSKETFWP